MLFRSDLNNFTTLNVETNIIEGNGSVIISDNFYNNGFNIDGNFTYGRLVGDKGRFDGFNGDIYNLDPTFSAKQKSRLLFLDYDMGSKLNFFDSNLEYRLPNSINIDNEFELKSLPGIETELKSKKEEPNNFTNILKGGSAWNYDNNDKVYKTQLTYSGSGPDSRTGELIFYNFAFEIPENATIKGIEVKFTKESDRRRTSEDTVIISTTIDEDRGNSENKAIQFPLVGYFWYPIVTSTYGGSDDTWGLDLYPELVNSPNFNVKIRSKTNYTGDPVNLEVHSLELNVYYTDTIKENHNWLAYFKDENKIGRAHV